MAALMFGGGVAAAEDIFSSAACVAPAKTRLIEWDVLPEGTLDTIPGALVVDDRSSSRNSKVWFVTKIGEDARVYRLTPGRNLKKDKAEAKSWPLGTFETGGLRLRHSDDGRLAFVNGERSVPSSGVLVAIDTHENKRITWDDRPFLGFHTSDVAVDTRGGRYSVFTAALDYNDAQLEPGQDPGFVQRLQPGNPKYENGKWVVPADVTRWNVGGGAGECTGAVLFPPECMPGITVDRRHGHPVYFSAPEFGFSKAPNAGRVGAIGELDPRLVKCSPYDAYPSCSKVRYWPLPIGTVDPRQLSVDEQGRVWAVTGSGHIVSLQTERSNDRGVTTRHDPKGMAESLHGVAPDGGTIGFTDTDNNEVSVLFPQRITAKVVPEVRLVRAQTTTIPGVREDVMPVVHMVDPRVATPTIVQDYTIPGDGSYIETNIASAVTTEGQTNMTPSANPTGIYPDGARRSGSFFYGVGLLNFTFNRVGQLEVLVDPDKELDYRRDDDDYDDDGDDDAYDGDDDNDGIFDASDSDDDNDCVLDLMDKDKDNDGIENEYDSQSHRENKQTDRGQIAPGQVLSYDVTSDARTALLLGVVEAASLTTPLSMQIVDPNGVVVLSTPPALGKAVFTAVPALPGVYTVRVTNGGLTSTTYKTRLLTRQIWF